MARRWVAAALLASGVWQLVTAAGPTPGLVLVVAALAWYLAIPRRVLPARAVSYGPLRSTLLPDLVAALLAVTFFALPPLVTGSMNVGLFAGDWAWFTATCWLLALAAGSIWIVSAFHASAVIAYDGQTFSATTLLRRSGVQSLRELAAVEYWEWRTPPSLRFAARAIPLVNWRAAGPALLLRDDVAGLRLRLRDGTTFRYPLGALRGAREFIGVVAGSGVPVDPRVVRLLGPGAGLEREGLADDRDRRPAA